MPPWPSVSLANIDIASGVIPWGEATELLRVGAGRGNLLLFLNFAVSYDDASGIFTVPLSTMLVQNVVPVSATVFNGGFPVGNGVQACFAVATSRDASTGEFVVSFPGKTVPPVVIAGGAASPDQNATAKLRVQLVNAQAVRLPAA